MPKWVDAKQMDDMIEELVNAQAIDRWSYTQVMLRRHFVQRQLHHPTTGDLQYISCPLPNWLRLGGVQ